MREDLDNNDPYSYAVNETFIDTLALEGLGYFDLSKDERVEAIDNAINNAILVKGVIDELGENGWKKLFEVCQTGNEEEIRGLMIEKFGNQPQGEMKDINDVLPKMYDETLWGRFKELAIMIYFIRQDPSFQINNSNAVGYQQRLIIEWSGLNKEILSELD